MSTLGSIWQEFLGSIESTKDKNKVLYSLLKQLHPQDLTEDKIVVSCDNQGLNFFLQKKLPEVEAYLAAHFKRKMELEIVVIPKKTRSTQPLFDEFRPTQEDIFGHAHLSPKYSFSNFAVAGTNQVAYAAATAVAEAPGHAYNPLFLWGGVGVGKTHLAQAVGRKVLEDTPDRKVLFTPSEQFTNEIVEAIRVKSTQKFKRKYRGLHLLIIDDVQFIAGKNAVQEEFFHTFNTMVSSGGQIILTSDKPPHEIKGLEDRLRSRFSGGLIVDVQEPDFELRTAIILIKSQEKNIEIDIEAAKLIAQEVSDSRGLEGALLSIYAKSLSTDQQITPQAVEEYFSGAKKTTVKKITTADVVKTVCSYYDIKQSHLKGPVRSQRLSLPRQVAMFLLRRELGLKYEEIAYILKKKDHTTIIHGVEKVQGMLVRDTNFAGEIDRIVKTLAL